MLFQHSILLVDDEPDVLKEFRIFLNRKGFNVLLAENGLDAMRTVKRDKVDLIITDYHMPEITGMSLLKELQELAPQIPVIMMSGVADMRTGLEALKNHAFDFLSKPVDSKELLAVINKALDRAKRKKQSDEKKADSTQYIGLLSHSCVGSAGNISAVVVNAALDEVTEKKLRASFERILDEKILSNKVVFVLNKITYMNNIGLNILIDWKDTLAKKNAKLVLTLLSNPVKNYLKSLGYLDFFQITNTLPEAIDLLEIG